MTRQMIATLALIVCTMHPLANAEEFSLRHDKTGNVYGPFQTTDGQRIAIGSATFTVVSKSRSLSPTEEKLQKMIIPTVDMSQAHIENVAEFLRHWSKQLDTVEHKGVPFMVNKRKRPEGEKRPLPRRDYPLLTLTMGKANILDVVKMICEQTGCTYKILAESVVFIPPAQ
jgi:hypothetical protein